MGKVIVMSTQPQPSPPVPAGSEAPFAQSDFRNLSVAVDIYEKLGGLTTAVDILKASTKSHAAKIERLTRKTEQTAFRIPYIESAVAQNSKDLNEIGEIVRSARAIASTARTLGKVAVGIVSVAAALTPILVLLYKIFFRR
jgi:hypothetical protein